MKSFRNDVCILFPQYWRKVTNERAIGAILALVLREGGINSQFELLLADVGKRDKMMVYVFCLLPDGRVKQMKLSEISETVSSCLVLVRWGKKTDLENFSQNRFQWFAAFCHLPKNWELGLGSIYLDDKERSWVAQLKDDEGLNAVILTPSILGIEGLANHLLDSVTSCRTATDIIKQYIEDVSSDEDERERMGKNALRQLIHSRIVYLSNLQDMPKSGAEELRDYFRHSNN